MIFRLLHTSKYFHLKLIHQHPNGINNRFRNNADKWVQSLRHPQIKTYYQFFQNQQTHQHDIKLKLTDKQQNSMEKIKHSYKPGISALTEIITISKPVRPDDSDMERDVKDLTLSKFIEEGRQNLSPTHKLLLTAIGFIVVHTILYFSFIYGKELPKNERVKVLNAQLLQSYHFQSEQADIKRIIERIQIVNGQLEKRLTQNKTK